MFTILDKPESRRKLSPEVMLNIKRELDAFSATILERRLLTETVKDLSGWSYCQHECISDILKDMRSLEEGEIHRPAEDLLPFISRRRRGLRCATTFQVDSHTFQPSLPMNQDLQMALWCEGSIVLNLSFSSRWKLWQAMSLLLSVLDSFPSSCTKPPHLHLENEIVTKIICTNNSLDADAVSFQPAKLVFSSSLDESSPAFIDIIPVKDCGLALYEEYARRILLNSIQKVSFGVDSPNTNSYLLVLKFNAFTPDPTMVQKPNNKYYLVVQYKSETFSTSLETLPNLHWNQTFEFDVSTHDLEADLSHLHVFLFEKPSGFGPVDLLGEQRISLGVLLRFEEEGGWNKANAEAMMDRWTSRYELLNTRTSIDITVIEAVYLKTAVVGDVFIKCSMVSSVPHTNKEEVCFREFKSSPVRATKKDIPFDGNAIFTLHAREGMQTADLVRLRVLIGSSFHVDIIGQVLIPLSDCCLTEKEALYDVRTVNGTEGSVGQLRIRILRREESIPRTAGVELLSRLRRSHEYNTQWCAECIPSSLLQNEDYFHEESHEGKKARDNNIGQSNRRLSCVENAVEMYKLFPSYENLILVEDNICTLSVGSNDELCFKYEPYALSSYNRIILEEGEEEGEGGVESVYLFYFENERRGALPPHSFLSDHLVVDDDPPHFSDESGLREFVYNEEPPEGYSWMEGNDWFIDSKYYIKQCDSGGWIYADNFYDLRDRCTVYCLTNVFPLLCVKSFDNRHSRKGVATAGDSSSLQVRRRKWTRKVRSDPIPQIKLKSSSYCSYREEYMQNAPSEAIIRYCREKESFRAPVLIPYSQVTALSICSDSILMIQVSIGRFDGVVQEKEVFTDMRMEMFVTNCPALRLKALVEERIAVLPSRQMIGRVFLPVPENQYQESEGYSSLFGVDLRLRIVAFCEDEIARYESKPIKEPHDVIYSTRLKVYLASLCSFSALSNDGHRRVESMEVVTLRGRIDGTLDERESEAEGRVPRLSCCIKDLQLFIAERFRGTLLSGLSMGRKDLKLRLSSLLHDFYHAFINLCGPFFVHSALLPSLESKISFLKVFLNVDNCLEAALQRSFGMIYGFIVSPAPSLSTVLSLDSLITFFMAGTLESFDRMYDSIVMVKLLNQNFALEDQLMAFFCRLRHIFPGLIDVMYSTIMLWRHTSLS